MVALARKLRRLMPDSGRAIALEMEKAGCVS